MRPASRQEFDEFLKAYPRPLERDVYMACEPPYISWNDFTRAPCWPDSIVATHVGDSYHILEDINAPVVPAIQPDLEPLYDMDGNEVHVGDTVRVWWGFSSKDGERYREHTVEKDDVGTNYEQWSISGCANIVRNMSFKKVP
jgi:hypothetical protein